MLPIDFAGAEGAGSRIARQSPANVTFQAIDLSNRRDAQRLIRYPMHALRTYENY